MSQDHRRGPRYAGARVRTASGRSTSALVERGRRRRHVQCPVSRASLFSLRLLVALAAGVGAGPSSRPRRRPPRGRHRRDGRRGAPVVITFSEDSITGIEALQRAARDPAVYSWGRAARCCGVFGVGRDAGPNCLAAGR